MSNGFCYVADHEGYVREAAASAASLKHQMPDAEIVLICPASLFPSDSVFDLHLPSSSEYSGPISKAQATSAPFERVILLDTDTYVAGDLGDLFRILDNFDLAAAHEPTRGWDYPCKAPPAFCELNTGVLAFRNNSEVRSLFVAWLCKYCELREAHALVNDQPAFRAAVWEAGDLRIATLPSEFHCIVGKPVSIAWEARLLHGRGDLPAIAGEINEQLGYRAFIPGWGQMRGFAGRRQLLRQYLQLSRNFFRMLFLSDRRTDTSAQAPVQWWKS